MAGMKKIKTISFYLLFLFICWSYWRSVSYSFSALPESGGIHLGFYFNILFFVLVPVLIILMHSFKFWSMHFIHLLLLSILILNYFTTILNNQFIIVFKYIFIPVIKHEYISANYYSVHYYPPNLFNSLVSLLSLLIIWLLSFGLFYRGIIQFKS